MREHCENLYNRTVSDRERHPNIHLGGEAVDFDEISVFVVKSGSESGSEDSISPPIYTRAEGAVD